MNTYDIIYSISKSADRKELMDKYKKALEKHDCNIYYKPSRDSYWTRVRKPDGKRKVIEKKTKESLLKALDEYYKSFDPTIEEAFEKALELKIIKERPNPETVRAIRIDFNKYIKGLSAYKLSEITDVIIDDYIINTIISLKMSEKQLRKLKGVLNLIYDWAMRKDVQVVSERPYNSGNKIYKKHCVYTEVKPEEKAFQPDDIEKLRDYVTNRINSMSYDHNGLMILFSIETGMRSAELCALKWEDIAENSVRVHSQILSSVTEKGHRDYRYEPSTKNEKGVSRGGRIIPNTPAMKAILKKASDCQKVAGITSEYVFCKSNGEFTNGDAYRKALEAICDKLQLRVKNNHAIRMYYNSYILMNKYNLVVEIRAKLLGHSVDVNLKHYTFMLKEDDFIMEMLQIMDVNQMSTNIVVFPNNEKVLETACF